MKFLLVYFCLLGAVTATNAQAPPPPPAFPRGGPPAPPPHPKLDFSKINLPKFKKPPPHGTPPALPKGNLPPPPKGGPPPGLPKGGAPPPPPKGIPPPPKPGN